MNDLIAQTKEYILQNYALSDRVFADQESYRYFVEFAMKNKQEVKQAPVKKVAKPTPPPIIQMRQKPKPAPKQKPKELQPQSKKVELIVQEKKAVADHSDFQKSFAKQFPTINLIDTPPDDIIAKQRKKKEAEIIIVSSNDNPKENAFLHHLAAAINRCHAPATVLSSTEAKEQKPKLFIGTGQGLSEPKLIIQPISNYLKDPQLKAKLWKEIQCKFKP